MLKIRFRFDGKCRTHPRYNPNAHGRPTDAACPGCESLYVIELYVRIAEKKARAGDGIVTNYKSQNQPGPEQSPTSANDHEPEAEQQVEPQGEESRNDLEG